jgi:hypothetical protein
MDASDANPAAVRNPLAKVLAPLHLFAALAANRVTGLHGNNPLTAQSIPRYPG